MQKLVHFYGGICCQIRISTKPNNDARLSVDPLSSSSTLSKLFLSYREYLSPLELSKTAKAALQTAKRLSSSLTLLDFSEWGVDHFPHFEYPLFYPLAQGQFRPLASILRTHVCLCPPPQPSRRCHGATARHRAKGHNRHNTNNQRRGEQ